MKKFVAILAALTVAFAAAGCSTEEPAGVDQAITLPNNDSVSGEDTVSEPIEGPSVVEEEFDKNKADGTFVSKMLPYDYQGVEMNILATRNTTNMDVLMLASIQTENNKGRIAIFEKYFWDWSLPYYQGDRTASGASFRALPKKDESSRFILVHGGDGADHTDDNYLVDENPIYMEGYVPDGFRLMPGMLSDEEMLSMFNAQESDFDSLWVRLAIERNNGAIALAEEHQSSGIHPILLDISKQMIDTLTKENAQLENMLGE